MLQLQRNWASAYGIFLFFIYLLVLEGTGQKYSNINTALTGIYKSDDRLLGMTRTWPSFLLKKQGCRDKTYKKLVLPGFS